MTLGEMIRKAREKKGMTQTELGRKIGIRSDGSAQVVISRYERDVSFPAENLMKLVDALGLPKTKVLKMAMSAMWSI